MSVSRARIPIVAVVSASVFAGLAVAETSAATNSDTIAETGVATTAETAKVEILSPGEPWAGVTHSEWAARGYQWTFSMPADVNPILDPTGEPCGLGQSGPVFFYMGNFAGADRTRCVVAEGTAIYVHVVGKECSTVEPPPYFGRTEDELRACASATLDHEVVDFEARVNGEDVADLDTFRNTTPMFTITFPENNVYEVDPGVARAVAEQYSFIIAPPPPGEYEIFTSYIDSGGLTATTVTVVVEAPKVIEAPPTTT